MGVEGNVHRWSEVLEHPPTDLDQQQVSNPARANIERETMSNWKTTFAGLIGAIAMAAANYSGPNTWQGYAACLFPIILGTLAKDFDSHSTTTQVSEATEQEKVAALNAANSIK